MARKDVVSGGNRAAQIVAEQIQEIESLRKRKTKHPRYTPALVIGTWENPHTTRLESQRLADILAKLTFAVDSVVSGAVAAPQKDRDTSEPHDGVSSVEEGSDVAGQSASTSDSAAGRR